VKGRSERRVRVRVREPNRRQPLGQAQCHCPCASKVTQRQTAGAMQNDERRVRTWKWAARSFAGGKVMHEKIFCSYRCHEGDLTLHSRSTTHYCRDYKSRWRVARRDGRTPAAWCSSWRGEGCYAKLSVFGRPKYAMPVSFHAM